MRHHQADKGDGADDGGGAAAQDGDDDQADQLGAGDAAAEGGGGIVARAQAVQRPAQQQSGDPRHDYRQQDNFQRLQGADIQRTGLPEA